MQSPRYKILGRSCDGQTRSGAAWKLLGDEITIACPTILQDGDYILVVGRMVNAGEVRKMGGSVEIGEQAVAIPRQVLLTAAEEMRSASART